MIWGLDKANENHTLIIAIKERIKVFKKNEFL